MSTPMIKATVDLAVSFKRGQNHCEGPQNEALFEGLLRGWYLLRACGRRPDYR